MPHHILNLAQYQYDIFNLKFYRLLLLGNLNSKTFLFNPHASYHTEVDTFFERRLVRDENWDIAQGSNYELPSLEFIDFNIHIDEPQPVEESFMTEHIVEEN